MWLALWFPNTAQGPTRGIHEQALGDTGTMHLLFQPWVTEPELTVEN